MATEGEKTGGEQKLSFLTSRNWIAGKNRAGHALLAPQAGGSAQVLFLLAGGSLLGFWSSAPKPPRDLTAYGPFQIWAFEQYCAIGGKVYDSIL